MKLISSPPIAIDFFCIGAGKCGSSWLAQCLAEHPEITVAKTKEPNFFVRKLSAFGGERNEWFMKDWDWYRDQFSHAGAGDLLGDFSVNLMHNTEDAPKIIRELYPSAKLVVILRDPVARTYSHYWHERYHDRIPGVPASFEEGLQNEELLFRSRFGEQLAAWREEFPRESFFLILDFELAEDSRPVMCRLLDFLGADNTFQPPSLYRRVNESSRVSPLQLRLERIAKAARARGLGPLLNAAERVGVQRTIRAQLTRRRRYPPMPAETAQMLRCEFRDDINRLEDLIAVDLSAWKKGNRERSENDNGQSRT